MAAVVGTAALLSGCWTQVGFDATHRNHNSGETALTEANVRGLHEVWSVPIEGTASEPMLSDGKVFVTRTGTPAQGVGVRALDLGSGATVWDRELLPSTSATPIGSPSAIAGGQVHAGYGAVLDAGGIFRCGAAHAALDPKDGTGDLVQDGAFASPPVTAGSVVLHTSIVMAGPNGVCTSGYMSLVVRDDSTGTTWTAYPPGNGSPPSAATSLPTVADGYVYVAYGTTISAFPLAGCGSAICEPQWSVDVPGTTGKTPIAGEKGDIFVGTIDGDAIALNAATGAERWRTEAAAGTSPAMLALADGRLFVAESSGPGNHLRAYATAGCGGQPVCGPTWTGVVPTTITSAPVVAGGLVYIGAQDWVIAFVAGCPLAECGAIASVPFAGQPTSLSVAQGRLLVGGADRVAVYAP